MNYVVEFVGGGTAELEVPEGENLGIALSEQFTAYGDCEIDMVWDRDDPDREVCEFSEPSPQLSLSSDEDARLWREHFARWADASR